MKSLYPTTILLLLTHPLAWAGTVSLTVGGIERSAEIRAPAAKVEEKFPVVFLFHGHGGRATRIVEAYDLAKRWPEALVVAPQGLPTPGAYDPGGERSGWQKTPGDQGDRDIDFFDALLEEVVSRYPLLDRDRVYASGHSNGGGFTYLLAALRPETFAAIAPSAAGGRNVRLLRPLPVFHIAGKMDTVVRFVRQERAVEALRDINGCARSPVATEVDGAFHYPSSKGAPVTFRVHPGGHGFQREIVDEIVDFFEHHRKDPEGEAQMEPQGEKGIPGESSGSGVSDGKEELENLSLSS